MGKQDRKKHALEPAEETAAGMLGLMGRFARQLPGASFAEEQLNVLEKRAMRELKQRLDAVDDRRLPAPNDHHPVSVSSAESQVVSASLLSQHPAELLTDLLERAYEQTAEQAQLYLYTMILRELVPDEARLLGALSDGAEYPLLHIGVGPPIGTPRRVAENFSNLGKTATLKLREFTPAYITHLRNLDLLETGPEDKEQEIKYQILESDKAVREVVAEAEKGTAPGMGVRFIRRVIRISPLGQELWNACQPGASEVD